MSDLSTGQIMQKTQMNLSETTNTVCLIKSLYNEKMLPQSIH